MHSLSSQLEKLPAGNSVGSKLCVGVCVCVHYFALSLAVCFSVWPWKCVLISHGVNQVSEASSSFAPSSSSSSQYVSLSIMMHCLCFWSQLLLKSVYVAPSGLTISERQRHPPIFRNVCYFIRYSQTLFVVDSLGSVIKSDSSQAENKKSCMFWNLQWLFDVSVVFYADRASICDGDKQKITLFRGQLSGLWVCARDFQHFYPHLCVHFLVHLRVIVALCHLASHIS